MTNKALVAGFYEVWNASKGSVAAAENGMAFIAEDAEFRSLADGEGADALAFTNPRKGRAEIREYFEQLAAHWSMNHFTVRDLLADGEHVVAISDISFTNNVTGKTAEGRKVDVWLFRDGLAVSFEEFYDPRALQRAATA